MNARRPEEGVAEQSLQDPDPATGSRDEHRAQLSAAPLERVVLGAARRRRRSVRVGGGLQRDRRAGNRHAQDQYATELAVAISTRILHLVLLLLVQLADGTGWTPQSTMGARPRYP